MSAALLLASTSPYRRVLLERLGLPFEVAAPNVDERPLAGESPEETALRLAQAKADAVAGGHHGSVVIGSDQVAVLGSARLGKPGTHEAALAQLLAARGRPVVFHTAVCVLDTRTSHMQLRNVPTTVHFRRYSEAQARRYLELEQPYDCAGSAKIEGLGIALVDRVESSDPTALVGLPLIAVVDMLHGIGIQVPAS